MRAEWLGLSDRMLAVCLEAVNSDIRWNLRASQVEVYHPLEDRWLPSNDRLLEHLFQRIEERVRVDKGKGWVPPGWGGSRGGRRRSAFESLLHTREVDPFVDWLEGLPEWDGTERVGDSLRLAGFEVADGTDPGLLEHVSRSTFLAAVARAYRPGVKYDEMPILISAQGIGKSGFYELSLPAEYQDAWYSDQIDLYGSSKEKLEASAGRVIVEAAELAGMYRKDVEKLKAWLSSRNDNTVRAAYARTPESRPRRFVVVGTTNDLHALPPDPSGNRRFPPVQLLGGSRQAVAEWWDQNRDQVWAEARVLYRLGVPHWMPAEVEAAQADAAERYRSRETADEEAVAWGIAAVKGDEGEVNLRALITQVKLPAHPPHDSMAGDPLHPAGLGYVLTDYRARVVLKQWRYETRLVWRMGKALRFWFPTAGSPEDVVSGERGEKVEPPEADEYYDQGKW